MEAEEQRRTKEKVSSNIPYKTSQVLFNYDIYLDYLTRHTSLSLLESYHRTQNGIL